jgi:hypothetical protein
MTDQDQTSSPAHELVLYKNRKFRSRKERRYLTLDEIAEAIQRGDEVRITRHETGEDVTVEYLKGALRYLDLDVGQLNHIFRNSDLNQEARDRRKAQVEKEAQQQADRRAALKASKREAQPSEAGA